MIKIGTQLKIIDNSGGRKARCIGVFPKYKQQYAFLGDIITVSVIELRMRRRLLSKVKKGEIFKAILVRTKKGIKTKTSSLQFFDNSIVLLNNQKKLIGTRVFGALPNSLRYTKHFRLIFLAAGLIK
jgi:large subunit ribosomal protein L14